ncbi:hypothetical protein V8F33_013086 [Rhypophila sp. PSN 637]
MAGISPGLDDDLVKDAIVIAIQTPSSDASTLDSQNDSSKKLEAAPQEPSSEPTPNQSPSDTLQVAAAQHEATNTRNATNDNTKTTSIDTNTNSSSPSGVIATPPEPEPQMSPVTPSTTTTTTTPAPAASPSQNSPPKKQSITCEKANRWCCSLLCDPCCPGCYNNCIRYKDEAVKNDFCLSVGLFCCCFFCCGIPVLCCCDGDDGC